jgi:hypothetical protein
VTANPLQWQGGDPDASYLDKVLRHGPVEVYFDEGVSFRTIWTLWLRATLAALPFMVLGFIVLMVSLLSLAGSRYSSSSSGAAGASTFSLVLFLLMPVVWLVVFMMSRVAEPLGEWRVVLADRSSAADHVYSAIQGKLLERQLPVASLLTRRTATGFGAVQNRLILVDGQYRVYVSVFAFGTSLYLGWIMYRHRGGGELLGQFILDLFASLSGKLDDIGRMLRTERPRALREVVHALCREGLNVAVQQIEVPLTYGFPNGLPPVEPLPGAMPQPAYQQPITGAWPTQPGTPG